MASSYLMSICCLSKNNNGILLLFPAQQGKVLLSAISEIRAGGLEGENFQLLRFILGSFLSHLPYVYLLFNVPILLLLFPLISPIFVGLCLPRKKFLSCFLGKFDLGGSKRRCVCSTYYVSWTCGKLIWSHVRGCFLIFGNNPHF